MQEALNLDVVNFKVLNFKRSNVTSTKKHNLDKNWIEKEIQEKRNESMYFFKRAQDLESRSQDLFNIIAKKESEKRILIEFLNELEKVDLIKDNSLKEAQIKKINNDFREKQIVYLNLEKYTENATTQEFILRMFSLNDLAQLKLVTRAITGNEKMADELLSSDIGMFELFIKDRKQFLSYAMALFKNISSSKKIIVDEVVKDTRKILFSEAI